MSTAESQLTKLKVPELKAICSKSGIAHSGLKKNELIERILASPAALNAAGIQSQHEAPEDATVEYKATEAIPAPSSSALVPQSSVEQEATRIQATALPSSSGATPSALAKPVVVSEIPNIDTTLDAEAEKRRKRAERFGVEVVTPAPTEATTSKARAKAPAKAATNPPKLEKPAATAEDVERLRKRAERFGLALNAPKAGASTEASTAPPVPAPTVVLDPAEEERKRKRLEKFGPVKEAPVEKKIKA